MTDNKFQDLLNELSKANAKYKRLLKEAEDELERRYRAHPSDIDNDQWIDIFHQGCGTMTVKEVDESMKLHMKRRAKS